MAAARPDGAARREALLDAALVCFAARGLVHTGIEDVRREAGASPSSVYHLFAGLPDLLAALLQRTFERRYAQVTARVLTARSARTAVERLVLAHLDWVFGSLAEARFMYQALALDVDAGDRDRLRAVKGGLAAELTAHLVARGALAAEPSPGAMVDVVLLASTHQACRAHFASPGSIGQAWMRRVLPGLAWQAARAMMKPAKRRAVTTRRALAVPSAR